jgi:predicted dienelactone hydrolase
MIVDHSRDGRLLGVDVWYPAVPDGEARSVYELIPGLSFDAAAALHEPAAKAGHFPLLVFSHGRTGMRFAYSLLCEALAARGSIVVSADHPGDVLIDWLLGNAVDDRTNELNRVNDTNFLIEQLLSGSDSFPPDILSAIDRDRIAAVGHSYGAYSALGTTAGAHGIDANHQIRAVVCLQPFTRTLNDDALERVQVPALLVVSEFDATTPAETDADRPWKLLGGTPTWRFELAGAGHQAASDLGLYAELAADIPTLPAPIRQYLDSIAGDAVGPNLRPWRELVTEQVTIIWAFLELALDINLDEGTGFGTRMSSASNSSLRTR